MACEQLFSGGENELDREPLSLYPYSEQSPSALQIAPWITAAMLGLCEWDDTHHSKGMKGNISRQPKWQCIYFSTIHIFTPAEDLAPEALFQSKKAKCLITEQQTAHSWCHSRCSLQKQKYFGNAGKKERTVVSYPDPWNTFFPDSGESPKHYKIYCQFINYWGSKNLSTYWLLCLKINNSSVNIYIVS